MDENSLNKTQFSRLPFDVISPQDQALQLGLVTLETDLTIDNEFHKDHQTLVVVRAEADVGPLQPEDKAGAAELVGQSLVHHLVPAHP